jgi:S-adenosylmethionine synthetase
MDGIAAIEKIVERHPDTLEEFFSRIYLNLRRPIYRATAVGGHFGRCEEGFTWERAGAENLPASIKRRAAYAGKTLRVMPQVC